MCEITQPIIGEIGDVAARVPGWTPVDELFALFCLAYAGDDGDIIEVGSWCGRAAVVLGLAARLRQGTCVHCIDLFPEEGDWRRNADGSYSIAVQLDGRTYTACEEQTVWAE